MNPRLRSILIVIGLLTVVIVAIILIPRGLSLYYQSRGGQHIEYVLRSVEGIQELVCEELPQSNQATIGEVEHGIADLNRAARFNRNNSQAYYYLGKANCLLGEPNEAKENYLRYTELRPDNPLGHIGLGFAYELLEDAVNSREAWIEAGLMPHEFNAVGDEKYKLEEYEKAIRWYEWAILINPRSVESLLKLGHVLETSMDHESALKINREAWEIDPEMSTSALINGYKRIGETNAFEEILQHMVQNYPDSSERLLWFQELGSSYLSHGEYDKAVELYSQAIHEYPKKPDLHISLGWSYSGRGDGFDAAFNEFEMAISLDEANGNGYYSMGLLLNQVENYNEAEKWLRRATEIEPENIWYALILGNTSRNAGKLGSAIDVYEKIIAHNPNYDRAYLEIALAYYLSNRIEEAVAASEKAIILASSPDQWYYTRAGVILEAAGDLETALRYYYQALAIDPSFPSALEGVSRLEDKNN